MTLFAESYEDYDCFVKMVSLPICEQILTGAMAPQAGMAKLLEIYEDLDEPLLLWVWVDLAADFEGYSTYNDPLDLTDRDACIRTTATQFIKLCTLGVPAKFPWVWQCRECGAVNDKRTDTPESAQVCPECKTPLAMRNMRFFVNRELLAAGKFGG